MKILVIIAHPTMDDSRINAYLKKVVEQEASVTVHDLYSTYPNEDIDVGQEQQLLEKHDRIIFQYPNYWYSYTPLLKKWFDKVLESGWAFKGSRALKGKEKNLELL
ncbi:NAD(P)H-dependent oxidoreductase [Radiobacillus kanasensis]|uniref:NAD(P)H-dependent oxidoreductase n=1 Tax=Radiobacillus kanasensis TaxID=2844358 RepID=UPI001E43421A|nr:NAD(P)H-dependent oxidoreductase [Radiobacillus kanasensis]UFU00772.1 NAD(P)H-dependent oxidoreductase [Radiobacillus kanasensis]